MLSLWKDEILRLKAYPEELFGVEITEEKVREAVKLNNDIRRASPFYEWAVPFAPPCISSGKSSRSFLRLQSAFFRSCGICFHLNKRQNERTLMGPLPFSGQRSD